MSNVTMADNECNLQQSPSHPHWGHSPHLYPHSHHGTPVREYHGFNFGAPPMPSANNIPHLVPMPQWPSMLNSQPQPMYQPLHPVTPMTPGPMPPQLPASSTRSSSTPRKTLTDLDRKRMCQYAEDHPGSKQTDIGAVFGVERSTVSKVLRQKEKYLSQDEESKSPVKRGKIRPPDIERALSVWVRNQLKKGNLLTDEILFEQARAFAVTSSTPDNPLVVNNSWIEKFKLKYNLLGARSRKTSLATDDLESTSLAASSSHTPADNSPTSPPGLSPTSLELHSTQSQESLKTEDPDTHFDRSNRRGVCHSLSTASLQSGHPGNSTSSFSPDALSPTSPLFTPDSGTAPSPFTPYSTTRHIVSTTIDHDSQRPRSQTFPLLDQYMMPPGDPAVPKYMPGPPLDSPMEESVDPLISLNGTMTPGQERDQSYAISPFEAMRPPPLPAHVLQQDVKRESTPLVTSPEEARRALQVVLSFFEQQQPQGFGGFHESLTVGKLMERLNIQSRSNSTS